MCRYAFGSESKKTRIFVTISIPRHEFVKAFPEELCHRAVWAMPGARAE